MTKKQFELLCYIRNMFVHTEKVPTFSEMKTYMSVSSNQTIDDWLQGLEREGYIKNRGKLRGRRITDKGMNIFGEKVILNKLEAINRSYTDLHSRLNSEVSVYNISNSSTNGIINLKATGNALKTWREVDQNGSS